MPFLDLALASPERGQEFYLDTSAIFPIAGGEGAKSGKLKGLGGRERKRCDSVGAFVKKAHSAGAVVRTTVLALEEIASAVRNRVRHDAQARHNFDKWGDFERAKPEAASLAGVQAQTAMLEMLQWAGTALGNLQVPLERTPVPGSERVSSAELLRKAHRKLLANYGHKIDSMDALHIAIGIELGSLFFVSFDRAWTSVNEITVLIGP